MNHISQGYPLWAVRARSIDEPGPEIGLVIGWEDREHYAQRIPIVASLGRMSAEFAGSARDWPSEIVRSEDPDSRWVERVELYGTFEEARIRAAGLFRDVWQEHGDIWPDVVSAQGKGREGGE